MTPKEQDPLNTFLKKYDQPAPQAPTNSYNQILSRIESSSSIFSYWPQWLATAVALLVIFFAFQGHHPSNIQTDEDLAAFLNETYMRDELNEEGDSDYFILTD